MNRFLNENIKNDIDYVVDNIVDIDHENIKKEIYYEVELFLRAKYKLKESGLIGTKQQYEKKLDVILNTIRKTNCFIETSIVYRIPAPYPAIIDNLINNLLNIFGWDKCYTRINTKYIMHIVENKKDFKLRKVSIAYDEFINKIYKEYTDEEEMDLTGFTTTPEGGYEIGYTLLPTSSELLIHRECEDNDINIYMNHPLFFTNGI